MIPSCIRKIVLQTMAGIFTGKVGMVWCLAPATPMKLLPAERIARRAAKMTCATPQF